jgi:hypothetical protein
MVAHESGEDVLMASGSDNGRRNGGRPSTPTRESGSTSNRDEVAERLREVDQALEELDEAIGERSSTRSTPSKEPA